MLRVVLAFAVIAVLAMLLLRRMHETPATLPRDVQGEIKPVAPASAQRQVQDQLKQIEQANRARLDGTMQNAQP